MNTPLPPLLQRLGLQRQPFPAAPDVHGYVASAALEADHIEAAHVLRSRAGFVLLSGEVGTGKTTFLRRLIDHLDAQGMAISLVFNTFLQGPDLLAAVLRDFGLESAGNAAADIERLNDFLIQRWQAGTVCVLVLDDAQNLSLDSLELVRLLTNLETGREKLLQIVLCGQPELCTRLASPQLRQLTSRIVKHVQLSALSWRSLPGYVHARLDAAGGQGRLRLAPMAGQLLYRLTGGNPRRIHLVMDRALYGLPAEPQQPQRISCALLLRAASEAGAHLAQRPRPLAWGGALLLAIATGSMVGLLDSRPAQATQSTTLAPSLPSAAGCQPARGFTGPYPVPASFQQLPPALPRCLQLQAGQWLGWWPDPGHTGLVQLQQQLQQQGQYDGRIDGLPGPMTQRALARLQQQWQLPATGQLDPATEHLLRSLGAGIPSPHLPETTTHGHG